MPPLDRTSIVYFFSVAEVLCLSFLEESMLLRPKRALTILIAYISIQLTAFVILCILFMCF